MRETNEERWPPRMEPTKCLVSLRLACLSQVSNTSKGLRAEAVRSKVVWQVANQPSPEEFLTRIYPIDVSTIIKYGISTSRRFLLTFTWHDSRNPNDQD